MPEAFPKLVVNTAFSSLVEPLREEPERKWLADMLESRPAPPITSGAGAGAGAAPPELALAGLSILWIDDNPEANQRLVERLRDSGAHVAEATGFADAFPILGSAAIDVIVSDVSRDDRSDAGFDDLRKFQAGDRGRPTVFFTARVTPSRRERAQKLGAEITADTGELLHLLQAFATRRADRSSRDRPLEGAAAAAR